MLRRIELLMIILFSLSIESFRPPSYGGITKLLFISHTDTCNKNFGTIYFSE